MRRNAALLTMLATELGVVALALFFHLRSRTAILAAFHDYGTPVPPAARVALSAWLLPAAIGVAVLASIVALVAPLRRRHRAFLVGLGLVVASVALVFAVVAAFLPLFQPA